MMSRCHRAGTLAVAALLAAALLLPDLAVAQAPPSGGPVAPNAGPAPGPAVTPAAVAPVTVPTTPAPTAPAPTAPAPTAPAPTTPMVAPATGGVTGSAAKASAAAPPGASQEAGLPASPRTAPTGATTDSVRNGMLRLLSDDLSPWGMFRNADIVVKLVICALILASIVTWTIGLAKTVELALAKRPLKRAVGVVRGARSLTAATEKLGSRHGAASALLREAADEWRRSVEALDDPDGLKERVALHLERAEAQAARRMMAGTGVLASIGSTAPFVGLFGTVWGIMNSFIGISKLHTTNLAVVAPGIAEALLATACGLVAAIPAVVIYNHFARQTAGYKALVANAAAAVMALVSRDLSRGDQTIADMVRNEAARAPAEPSRSLTFARAAAE